MNRLSDRAAIGLTIAALAVYVIARRTVIPDGGHFATNVAMIGVVAAIAAGSRLTSDEVGLSRAALPAGLRVGALAVVIVGAVVAVGVSVAGADVSFVQDRTELSGSEVLFQAFVEIPVATVLFEELAFRGVLGSLFHRVCSPWRAVAATSLLFGLWHVPSALNPVALDSAAAALGTLAATTAAGVVFQLMKDRTGSLAAPALAHWATNGLALLVAWAVTT